MPSVVAVCDIRTMNVMKGAYPKYRKGEDHPSGALWVGTDTSIETMVFMIGHYANKAKLTILRIFAHASTDKITLGANPLDLITADDFGRQLRINKLLSQSARIELHCCKAVDDSSSVWQGLANAANAEVWASPDLQDGKTIGFDGRLVKFRPKSFGKK